VVADERARLDWLRPRHPSPEVVAVDGCWLVLALPPGHPAHAPELSSEPASVPLALGAGLRRLHQLPVGDCPFVRSWETIVAEIEAGIDGGRLDARCLPEPYRRYGPERLGELVRASRPPPPPDPVVGHGSPGLSNLFVGTETWSGVIGVHRLGVADRHLDLAVIHRSIAEVLGPQALFGFYEGYGADPDLVRLDHYLLLDLLLTAIGASGAG
jgi:aminoglycoside phosphotransferase